MSKAPEKVDLNHASVEELASLPGVGKETAESVIEYRQAHGHFKSPEEIEDVPRIDGAMLKRLQEYVTVTPSAAERSQQGGGGAGEGDLDINHAGREQLEALPGIGQEMAEAIINYRKSHEFQSVDELKEVSGIDGAMLDRIRSQLHV